VIHPGGVKTGIASSALAWAKQSGREVTAEQEDRARFYNEKLLKMDPPRAAQIIVDGVEANRPRVLVGNDAKLMDAVIRVAPRRWPAFFSLLQRRFEKEYESKRRR
jgi:hypothetical protein